MDLGKMDESISEMEMIVSKMTNIKDSYEVLESCSKKLEAAATLTKQHAYNFIKVSESLEKSYSQLYTQNEQISRETINRIREITNEISKVQHSMNESFIKQEETIKNRIEKIKIEICAQYQKIRNMNIAIIILLIITLGTSIFNIINLYM